MLFADQSLASRLELTDALATVEFAKVWARHSSFDGTVHLAVAGGHAGFAGLDSPLTQAFGLGLAGPVTADELVAMEEFYRSFGSAVNVESCPLADPSLLILFNERGYRPIEYSNVSARVISSEDNAVWSDAEGSIVARRMREDETASQAEVVIKSFFESGEVPEVFQSTIHTWPEAVGTHFFMAQVEGELAGGAMMGVHRGVASFGGAGTIPDFRNRGVQRALLLARIAAAAELECDLAIVATAPGSGSQRNVERQGFQVMYTRTKFLKEWQ